MQASSRRPGITVAIRTMYISSNRCCFGDSAFVLVTLPAKKKRTLSIPIKALFLNPTSMKRIFPLLLLPFIVCAFAQSGGKKKKTAPPKYTITGTVLEKHDYCGGAVPSPDQLHPKPYPEANAILYIKKGNSNTSLKIVDTVRADAQGKFSVQLPAGDYCFVEAWKKGKLVMPKDDQYNKWDTACYRKNYTDCDFRLQVTKNDNTQITLYHHYS